MHDRHPVSRRKFLLGGAAGVTSLAALSGCSSLPVVGESEPELTFDPTTLSQSLIADLPERPETYPAPVPEELETTHQQRAQELLDGVPSNPQFPNGVIENRLTEERAAAMEDLQNGVDTETPLDRLDDWRYIRSNAAEVRGTYDAANGDIDAETLKQRRKAVRRDLADFEVAWSNPGTDLVNALVVAHHLEELRTRCQRALTPTQTFPEPPTAAVFKAGRLVEEVERARATLDDLIGLHDAHRTSVEHTEYRNTLPVLARRLNRIITVSREQVDPYLREDAGPEDFQRDVEGVPAEDLFIEARGTARRRLNDIETARNRGNYARAVVLGGQALVAVLGLATAVDAIRNDEYGMPASAEDVRRHRDAAVSALQNAQSIEPRPLSSLLAIPAWQSLWEETYVFDDHSGELDENDVVGLVASFGLARHLAAAVPEVASRLREELDKVGGE